MPASKPLLVVRHVPWEGPHRILEAFEGVPVRQLDILEDRRALPSVAELCGAVLMGGPMSANDTDRLPRLAEELDWLDEALEAGSAAPRRLPRLATAGARAWRRGRRRPGRGSSVSRRSRCWRAGTRCWARSRAAPTVLHWHRRPSSCRRVPSLGALGGDRRAGVPLLGSRLGSALPRRGRSSPDRALARRAGDGRRGPRGARRRLCRGSAKPAPPRSISAPARACSRPSRDAAGSAESPKVRASWPRSAA